MAMADEAVAVFNDDGTYYAVSDRCPHGAASLSDGYLAASQIECPLHSSVFDLKTGNVLCRPATESVRPYAVIVEAGDVFIESD